MHEAGSDDWINFIGALVLAAFSVWVATLRPRTRVGLAFAALGFGFGAAYTLNYSPLIAHAPVDLVFLPAAVMNLLWLGGVIALAGLFPRPLDRGDRLSALAAAALAVALLVVTVYALTQRQVDTADTFTERFHLVGSRAAIGVMLAATFLFGLRFRREEDPANRRALALGAFAMSLYAALQAGSGGSIFGSPVHATDGARLVAMAGFFLALLLVAGTWLAATRGPDARIARNTALAALALCFVGLVLGAQRIALGGLFRFAMVLVLGYAILRHELLGVDVKVRWAISKSTVAAAFVAAFFVASEGAQLLFGAGNEWVGLAAAGALVFAIAPLQRAAERLAERAVPLAASASVPAARAPHEEAYRAAVRLALRGGITRREELELARIADAHGIAAVRAHELRDEVERDGADALAGRSGA